MNDARQLNAAQERAMDLMSFLAVNLVDHPDEVRIDLVEAEDREVFRIHLHPDDQGQFIGKNGQTARAIRALLAAINARGNQRFAMEIVED
ncbi:MAG TPA: KH domain-containing protein [Candidatus Krumholzibacteria bacterium]|nr:KH domain-containing protein [Candidatus Krumholzibacteria bacterium]HPD71385.1 KH domain-containing protein [Candidatus Krumholzibacteria bacterium]HRY38915.1 KH domain-containing protein [Candidatus Krumholzibacteria bacterium]